MKTGKKCFFAVWLKAPKVRVDENVSASFMLGGFHTLAAELAVERVRARDCMRRAHSMRLYRTERADPWGKYSRVCGTSAVPAGAGCVLGDRQAELNEGSKGGNEHSFEPLVWDQRDLERRITRDFKRKMRHRLAIPANASQWNFELHLVVLMRGARGRVQITSFGPLRHGWA
eukprot:6484239-Amphidinium_carterae.2